MTLPPWTIRLTTCGARWARPLAVTLATVLSVDACQRPTAQSLPASLSGRVSTEPGPVAAVVHGAFVGDAPDRATLRRRITDFEALTGKNLGMVHLFVPITGGFPAAACDEIRAGGATPLVSVSFPGESLDPVLAGTYDADFQRFVAQAAAWRSPILLRWGWEMNGDHAWSGLRNGGADHGPARFLAAWRHLRALAVGATNLTWVWCPDAWGLGPDETWNDAGAYYPGTDQVDWLGADGYGWQVSSDNPPLEIFNGLRLAGNLLSRYQVAGKPFIVAETAADRSDPRGGAWTESLWRDLARVKGLRAICWFNRDQDGAAWALQPGDPVTEAYRAAVATPIVWGPPAAPPPTPTPVPTNVWGAPFQSIWQPITIRQPGRVW